MKSFAKQLSTSGRSVMTRCGALAVFAAVTASASTLTFDFGLIGADGGSVCAHRCVLAGASERTFTLNSVGVGAIGYSATGAVGYVTQKPGDFGGNNGETGLGESATSPKPSDPDFEIADSTYLLIDNAAAFAAGYRAPPSPSSRCRMAKPPRFLPTRAAWARSTSPSYICSALLPRPARAA